MEGLYAITIFSLWALIGTVWSAMVTRAAGTSLFLPITLLLWPLSIPIGLCIWLYHRMTGQDLKKSVREADL